MSANINTPLTDAATNQDTEKTLVAECSKKLEIENAALKAIRRKDIAKIEQLCGMVNNFAGQLGLGNKVHAEDWTDRDFDSHAALKAALEKSEAAMAQLLAAAVMAPNSVRQFPPFALGENMVDDALAVARQALAAAKGDV